MILFSAHVLQQIATWRTKFNDNIQNINDEMVTYITLRHMSLEQAVRFNPRSYVFLCMSISS